MILRESLSLEEIRRRIHPNYYFMETPIKSKTNSAVGIAVLGDAFQAGREAAQMAKAQLRDVVPQAVLAFGPSGSDFKEFMEGVRLVTGGHQLVGIPTQRVMSHQHFFPQSCVVLMIRSDNSFLSIGSTHGNQPTFYSPVTALVSQFREQRSNTWNQYRRRGYLLISHQIHDPANHFPKLLRASGGLESWIVKFSPFQEEMMPIYHSDFSYPSGYVAIECLSNAPWGFSIVGIKEFKNQTQIIRESVKSSIRNALSQLKDVKPSFGLILFNFPIDKLKDEQCEEIFQGTTELIKNMPLVGLASYVPFFQSSQGWESSQPDSVMAILAPE